MRRLNLVVLLPFLFMDCAANMVFGGSFRNTLSAEAWHQRDHRYWSWTHKAINALFFWQNNHCRGAAAREGMHGSAWSAWAAKWTSAAAPRPV